MKPIELIMKKNEERRMLRAVQSKIDREKYDMSGKPRTRYPERLKNYGGDVEQLTPAQRRRLLKKQRRLGGKGKQ